MPILHSQHKVVPQDTPVEPFVEKLDAVVCLGVKFSQILTQTFKKRDLEVVVYPLKQRTWDVSDLSPCEDALLGLYSNGLAVLEAMLFLCRDDRIFAANILSRTFMESSFTGVWILSGQNDEAKRARAESFVDWRDWKRALRKFEADLIMCRKASSAEEMNEAMREAYCKSNEQKKSKMCEVKDKRISKGGQEEDSYPEQKFWKLRNSIGEIGSAFPYWILSDAVHGIGDWIPSEIKFPGRAMKRTVKDASYIFSRLICATAEACGVEDKDVLPVLAEIKKAVA